MVSTREITGSKAQILEQIQRLDGRILSAVLLVDEPAGDDKSPMNSEEFDKWAAEMAADSVGVPHADDSTEAIYTRMPGE